MQQGANVYEPFANGAELTVCETRRHERFLLLLQYMAVTVSTNGVDNRDEDEIAVRRGIEAAIVGRDGNWEGQLTYDSASATWSVVVTGPARFKCDHTFSGTEDEVELAANASARF